MALTTGAALVRLLILDEDVELRERLSELLRGKGDDVASASSTSDALEQLETERFDLVFTELKGSHTDGMGVLREVHERWPGTRVVVITSAGTVDSAVEAMKVGAFDYVRKPFRADRVHEIVRRVRGAEELGGGPAMAGLGAPPAGFGVRTGLRAAHRAAVHELGEGRLERAGAEPGAGDGRVQKVLRIDAMGAPPNLLARLLVGSYITGQDQVLVTSRAGLTGPQRQEVRRIVDRILGMTVVAESPTVVEVQNFVDPGKYQLPRLFNRVVRMLRTELETCRAALTGRDADPTPQLDAIEEEVDRFYLLMVRQLLLSSDSPQIARSIDVESHHYQIGYRLVAKILEVIGDLIHGTGREIGQNLSGLRKLPKPIGQELVEVIERLEGLLNRTMDAFARLSAVDANATLNDIDKRLPKDAALGDLLARRIADRKVSLAAQRVVSNLVMLMEMLIIINEVTINRSVEPETVARAGASGTVPPKSAGG
jgi:ActR/RegA family two-component response regulator/phosphate uptake regulator